MNCLYPSGFHIVYLFSGASKVNEEERKEMRNWIAVHGVETLENTEDDQCLSIIFSDFF